MEIINKKDGESASDRILWDNILKTTIPQGRNVWAFSDDDSHSVQDVGYSWNMFIMPENTLENVRATMENGNFYAVAMFSRREGIENNNKEIPAPVITSITTDENTSSITITADNHNRQYDSFIKF
jgi:hypothetical protein